MLFFVFLTADFISVIPLSSGVEVLLIDTDHHQPLVILVRLIEARMKEFIAKAPTSSRLKLSSSLVETSIKDALKRLTILNAYDSTNLYTALLALDKVSTDQLLH